MKRLLILVLVILCACTPYRVKQATLRDTLFSVEQTNNGAWRVYVTHDDVAGYCTTDDELGERAYDLLFEHDGEVLIEFRAINESDTEYSFWGSSECGSVESGGSMFLIENIAPVVARD